MDMTVFQYNFTYKRRWQVGHSLSFQGPVILKHMGTKWRTTVAKAENNLVSIGEGQVFCLAEVCMKE